jgi:hypothetical protein
MALYAFDGTGNEDRDGTERDSNVLFFFEAYQDPLKNTDPDAARGSLYLKGIGTRAQTFLGDKVAEAFGLGGHTRLKDAKNRAERNVAAGDTNVDIVGFSRGAALAIDFGISRREYEAFMLLMFTPGYMAVYAEWRARPPLEFLFGYQTQLGEERSLPAV